MNYITRREVNKQKQDESYRKMYQDVIAGMSWSDLAHKYGYKNAKSARSCYYKYAVPLVSK